MAACEYLNVMITESILYPTSHSATDELYVSYTDELYVRPQRSMNILTKKNNQIPLKSH